jgi:surfactin synthase thioesterase subunit
MRLFCFPFAGGTASSFFDWRKRCNGLDVCPIEYPGRGSRWKANACVRLEALAETIAADLRCDLDQPFAVLGHSFGATVAFEFTRLLHRLASPLPVRLFVSAARAPHLPHQETIHKLPEREFLARLVSYDGIPPEVLDDNELLSLLLPTVRHDFRLFEEYRYSTGDPLPVPISVLGGLQDLKVPIPDLLAWSQHTTKSFRSRLFPGKHFFLYRQQCPAIDSIQDELKASTFSAFQ